MNKSRFLVVSLTSAWLFVGCSHVSKQEREPAMDMHARATAPVECKSYLTRVSDDQQKVINQVMGKREMRLHHALWHAVRGNLEPEQTSSLISTFGQSWTDFHSMCPSPDKDARRADYNPAGEDFLYMHHGMIAMLQEALVASDLQCISPWLEMPEVNDWPVPDPSVSDVKSPQALVRLKAWAQKFRDPVWLKGKSLSQVGWALENTIHNNLHMRYATTTPPKGFSADGAPITFDGSFPSDWQYDDPAYNWLADPYGAALNPVFWKIHGYVDSVLTSWLQANSFDEVSSDCSSRTRCYQWRGTWTGELTLAGLTQKKRNVAVAAGAEQITQARMRLQRLGVLTDQDLNKVSLPRGDSADPDLDPFLFAQKSLVDSGFCQK